MAKPIRKVQGFIIDAPNAAIKTKEGTYVTLTASQGQVAVSGNTLDIKGGQSPYNLLSVLTDQQVQITLTDAQFDGDLMEMYGAEVKEQEVERTVFTDKYIIDETYKIVIPHVIKDGSLTINGLEVTADSAAVVTGEVAVEIGEAETTLTFAADMEGAEVNPVYTFIDTAVAYEFLNDKFPRRGSVTMEFPLYEEDEDGNPTTTGVAQIEVYRASIVPNFTLGGSYKTASTFSVELKAEDPKRSDKKVWDIKRFGE